MKAIKFFSITLLSLATFTLVSCNRDDDAGIEPPQGKIAVNMTDAPADDSNVEGVFVTVAQVYIDGEAVEGFQRQTIEISAYTEGETKLILNDELDAGTYNQLQLELDHESDVDGNAPGCYVQTNDGNRHKLRSSGESSEMISLDQEFNITSSNETELVIDMDLRKCVKRDESGSSDDQYEFVAQGEMNAAFRMNDSKKTGSIRGNVNFSTTSTYDDVVVYAYREGSYTSAETEVNASTDLRYNNAVTSAKVNTDGSYSLNFLDEGSYRIVAGGYDRSEQGKSQFRNGLQVELLIGGILVNSVGVDAESSTSVDLRIL